MGLKIFNDHHSLKGSSLGLTGGERLSESGYLEKQEVSSIDLCEGVAYLSLGT